MNTRVAEPNRPIIVTFIEGLQRAAGFSATDVANVAAVSKATVSRWMQGGKKPHPDTELRLNDLHYIAMRLGEFYTPEEVRAWLYAHHPQLNEERAIELIREGRGKEVLQVINRLEADVYL